MWARTVQHWDKHLDKAPTFWFVDEEIMAKARAQKIEDERLMGIEIERRFLVDGRSEKPWREGTPKAISQYYLLGRRQSQ